MRGLKLFLKSNLIAENGVASFTDAWIETLDKEDDWKDPASHLLQMRGLKPISPESIDKSEVASFTDAWIETVNAF